MITAVIGGGIIGFVLVMTLPFSLALPLTILAGIVWGVFCGINDLP